MIQDPASANITSNLIEMIQDTSNTVRTLRKRASMKSPKGHLVSHLNDDIGVTQNVTNVSNKINQVGIKDNKKLLAQAKSTFYI